MRSQGDQATSDHSSAIDFFGKGSSSRKPGLQEEQDAEEDDAEEEDEEAEDGSEVPARRKRKLEVLTVKSKKKKKAIPGDTEGKHAHYRFGSGMGRYTGCPFVRQDKSFGRDRFIMYESVNSDTWLLYHFSVLE